ncbi:MAG TPA: C1 family peptidase, partial [Candidatus Glassbacteria bacterium]|nr:C1 family peptidase [Candidatus Glassbacteria bacterium]
MIKKIIDYIKGTPKKQVKKYGWKPDVPDFRDHTYSLTAPKKLPTLVDMRDLCPPIYDQGTLGSCTANAVGANFQFLHNKANLGNFMPSRLFVYYNERAIEGTIKYDAGAMLRTGIKTLNKHGVCPEPLWKYHVNKFKKRPVKNCYAKALRHKAVQYQRLNRSVMQMKACLAAGFPFVLGIAIYDSFESPEVTKTGLVPVPKLYENF